MPQSSGMTTQQSSVESLAVQIGESVFTSTRSRLGTHIDLYTVFEALIKAVPTGDNSAIADCLFEYLSITLPDFDRGLFESAPWFEIMLAFMQVYDLNAIPNADQYAILSTKSGGKNKEEVPWHYPGRNMLVWKHLLAKTYGWTLDIINNLWPEQAVIMLMEIIADEQIALEFQHQLSEVAYQYDKSTKKSKYVPLRRPMWMLSGSEKSRSEKKKSLITTLRSDGLPIGNVIRSENGEEQ